MHRPVTAADSDRLPSRRGQRCGTEREDGSATDRERRGWRGPAPSPADEYYDAGWGTSVSDILTARQPNGEGVPPEGLPYNETAGPRTLGHEPRAGSVGLMCENGGRRCSTANPWVESREMVTPTGGIIPAALAVRGQILRDGYHDHAPVASEVAVASR